ncbi:MAG: hypothetical protein QM757_27205 [Paludibaculum sp.]
MQRLAVVFVCLAGLFLLHIPAKANETQWIRVASPHLELFTTGEAETASQALIELESLRICFRSAVPGPATEPARLRIVAFSSESEYQAFRLNSYSPAYFVGGPGQRTIVLGRLTKESLSSLRHEFVHALAAEYGWTLPLWLAEGLAEQFAGISTQTARSRTNLLKQNGLPSLRELESLHDTPQDSEAARRFYAASWAMTSLLFTHPPYRDHFGALLRGGALEMTSWLAALGRSENRLNEDLLNQIDQLQPVSADEGTAPIQVESRKEAFPESDIQFVLVELQIRLGHLIDAGARLAALPESARWTPEFWRLTGDLALRSTPAGDAVQCYEKAMGLGSTDSRMLQQLAALRQGQAEAVPALERLLEVTPGNEDARLVLSSYYLHERRWQEAMAQLRAVNHPPPDRVDFYRRAIALAESHLEPSPVLLSTR